MKLDMRLVADQEPSAVFQQIVEYLRAHAAPLEAAGGVRFRITHMGDMAPSRTPGTLPQVQAVIGAVRSACGIDPVVMPSLGGSLPDYVWTRVLGVPSVVVPYANPDEDNHAPNENISLSCFYDGIRIAVRVFAALGELPRP